MAEELIERVTPSGVPFTVRNLVGSDQDTLTKKIKSEGESSGFNKMLHSALRKLGIQEGDQIKLNHINEMLSNDRIFILLTLRQHTLAYKKEFDFKYEWPLQVGKHEKQVEEYSVELNHENFPVVPYKWMRKKLAELKALNPEDPEPDGHLIPFPVIYENYSDMLQANKVVEGTFQKCGMKYRWELLDGLTENNYAKIVRDNMRINLSLEMRKIKVLFIDTSNAGKKDTWVSFETGPSHILDLEQLRGEILDIEGSVDTAITIQHPDDRERKERINLIALPVFFFPSLAK